MQESPQEARRRRLADAITIALFVIIGIYVVGGILVAVLTLTGNAESLPLPTPVNLLTTPEE